MRNIPANNLAYPILLYVDNIVRGSAFRLATNNKVFVVTAKHVIYRDEKLVGKLAEIHCPSGDINDDSVHVFQIDLEEVKPIAHKDSDVCVFCLAEMKENKKGKIEKKSKTVKVTALKGVEYLVKGKSNPVVVNGDFAVKRIKDVLISNDTFLYGYPTSLGVNHMRDFDFTKPLLRKGIVSNVNFKNGTILLDCRTDYGNSGGPVIEVSKVDGKMTHHVIGVVSKFLTLKNEWINNRDLTVHSENINAGYTIVVSMDKVFELTDRY